MAKKEHYFTTFEAGKVYHVYNRSVNNEPLFYSDENHIFFLKRYDFFLSDYIETYAWCLMKNHFHFLIRVKENVAEDLSILQRRGLGGRIDNSIKGEGRLASTDVSKTISNQFRKLFQGYTLAINRQQNRIGTLFQTPFKRSEVSDENYFCNMIYYIHSNPQHHEIVKDFRNYKWTSYDTILSDAPTKLDRGIVLKYFNDKSEFINFHQRPQNKLSEDLTIE